MGYAHANDLPFEVVVLDYTEEATWDDKKYLKLVDKSGKEWKLGKHLVAKYPIVQAWESGTPIKLTLDIYRVDGEDKQYVKDIERAAVAVNQEIVKNLAPQRNLKDISIERQCAVKCVVELICAGKEVDTELHDLTMNWLKEALK